MSKLYDEIRSVRELANGRVVAILIAIPEDEFHRLYPSDHMVLKDDPLLHAVLREPTTGPNEPTLMFGVPAVFVAFPRSKWRGALLLEWGGMLELKLAGAG